MRISILVLFAGLAITSTAEAQILGGIFGGRGRGANPNAQLSELTSSAQQAQNADQRENAVAALREFDAAANPEIVPLLVKLLQSDPDVNVRIEAARSLGRVRPLSAMARSALATASVRDSAFRVRWQARTSLMVFAAANLNPLNEFHDQPPMPPTIPAPAGQKPYISSSSPAGIIVPQRPANDGQHLIPPPRADFAQPLPKGPVQGPNGTNNPPSQTVPTYDEPPLLPPGGVIPPQTASPPGGNASEGPVLIPPGR